MRLSEIRGELYSNDVPDNTEERLELLRQKIENNEQPFIAAAKFAKGQFAWGDLEQLGWARKHQQPISRQRALVEVWWEYSGPNTIMAEQGYRSEATPMRAGDETTPVEVDYS